MFSRIQWVTLASLLVLSLAVLAQSPVDEDPHTPELLEDAASYGAMFGVDVDEAVRRLRLQAAIGDLAATLANEERETFAGLWIEHQPRYRIIIRFTDRSAEPRVHARVAGGPLADLVELRPARWPLAELERQQHESRGHAKRAGVDHDSDVNVRENRVELYVVDPRRLDAARGRLPEGVEVIRVDRLSEPLGAIIGGANLERCTGGFTVQGINSELGLSTAGHCPNDLSYQGVRLPFRREIQGDIDLQWNSACNLFDVTNQFRASSSEVRSCVGTKSRDQQVIGEMVCKYGITTNRTCGTISSKSFNGVLIRVEGGTQKLADHGDSGGPWYVGGVAYGITKAYPAADPNDAIYTAINYMSEVGARVLTSSPGPCNRPPVVDFTWTQSLRGTVRFDASSSYDPDGTIVKYDWDFGDGTTAVTSTATISHAYPTETATYVVGLIATDDKGRANGTAKQVTLCFPISCPP